MPIQYQNYLGSFVYPLLEETRAQLYSSMDTLHHRLPYAKAVAFEKKFIKFKLITGGTDSMIKLCLET
ncbi:hypothetical protein G4B88_029953 [Cannabis sativa]|uniref:Uncharacterized protein n=1 Tax=Cannabis sativa TaxID=3483 RepID=A0A7J6GAI1_CANSA|nr:hypothetical protein G4B88_029953 [Cannabis sativa]